MQIAQTTSDNCVARAISTMRLALGYEMGLPDNWKPGSKNIPESIALLGTCFPNETVIVACPPSEGIEGIAFPGNVRYIGSVMPFGETDGQINANDYLIAFIYGTPSTNKAHMVIGFPIIYDSSITIHLTVAVSLPKRNTGAAAVTAA